MTQKQDCNEVVCLKPSRARSNISQKFLEYLAMSLQCQSQKLISCKVMRTLELNTPGDPWKQLTSRFPRLGSHDSYVSRVEYRAMAKGSPLPQDKGLGAEML